MTVYKDVIKHICQFNFKVPNLKFVSKKTREFCSRVFLDTLRRNFGECILLEDLCPMFEEHFL